MVRDKYSVGEIVFLVRATTRKKALTKYLRRPLAASDYEEIVEIIMFCVTGIYRGAIGNAYNLMSIEHKEYVRCQTYAEITKLGLIGEEMIAYHQNLAEQHNTRVGFRRGQRLEEIM